MSKLDDMRKLTEEIIYSYELRISTVGEMIDNTYQLLNELKNKRVAMTTELRENLAHDGSVRKKDFDDMMRDILNLQDGQEKHISTLLKTYIKERQDAAHSIKAKLRGCKIRGKEEDKTGICEFRNLLDDIQSRQHVREQEITAALNDFKEKHDETIRLLRNLSNRDDVVKIRDLKMVLGGIQSKDMASLATVVQMTGT